MAVEPRKRRAAKADERRWWRAGGLALGVLLVLGSTGTWVSAQVTEPGRFPLKTIRITGELSHVDRTLLQQRVVAAIDGGFFNVDMGRLRDAAKQLPWVDRVSIRRVWPQTLIMDVTEQIPVARWGDKALVNGRGEVFRPESGPLPDGLPRFDGTTDDAPEAVRLYRLASTRLFAPGMQVTRLAIQGRRDWRLELDGGPTLLLTRANAARALDRFVRALPAIAHQPERRPERVDLRYENGFAVRWTPVEANDKKAPRGAA